MDCKTARLLLDFHRPRVGELPADEAAALERHLASCPECDAVNRDARRLDDCVGPSIRDVPVPTRLRERLLTRLKDERRAKVHRKLAWAARGFAVATAAALMAAVILWQVYLKPTKVNLDQAFDTQRDKFDSPSPEHVEAWFQAQRHVTMVAPKQFDYAYLAEYDLAMLQGKPVPKLVFQRTEDTGITRAHVFVLNQEQFDIQTLPDDRNLLDSGGQHLDIKKDSPHRAYLIVYDGDKLDPLMRDIQAQ